MSKHSEAAKKGWNHRIDREERMAKLRALIKMFDETLHIEHIAGSKRWRMRKGRFRVYRNLTPIHICFSLDDLESVVHSILGQTNV